MKNKSDVMLIVFLMALLSAINPLVAIEITQKNGILNWAQYYADERALLSQEEINRILDKGEELASKTDLIETLSNKGSALFPHCSILACGDQISAVVHACLEACAKTHKNQILILGALHPSTPFLINARRMAWKNPDDNPYSGIYGPGLPNEEEFLSVEYSLDSFVFLLEHAARRKGMPMPKIALRYPFAIFGHANNLPRYEELQHLAQESIVVGTSDMFHYGTAFSYYGVMTSNPDEKIPISEKGYALAWQTIEENLRLLAEGDWPKYMQYCFDTNTDGIGVRLILSFLLGPLEGTIRDLRLVDVSHFYTDYSPPNWATATLVELKPKKSS